MAWSHTSHSPLADRFDDVDIMSVVCAAATWTAVSDRVKRTRRHEDIRT